MSKRRPKSVPRAFPWRQSFLAALRQHGKVVDACRTASISRNSADAHRGDGKQFVVRAEEKLTAFLELESVIRARGIVLDE